jgi:putative transposase
VPEPERQNPAPGVHIQSDSPTIVFLTIHTADHGRWLAREDSHRGILEAWEEADAWRIGHYLLMPDHVHLFCTPVRIEFSIETWITFWKSRFSKRHRQPGWKWQSRGWHHRLRSAESYEQKLHYVKANPVRAGLVANAEDWPWYGKIHDLIWHG